ncbi:MAG: hypothetical protein IKX56_00770 [Muribaculaceae bacterium]|nr:hypothetical protein [Muribaculaceae bacterium]
MKRILTIFLALIIGLSMSAQIQNKILGFTLGTTTKSEVYNKYKNQEYFSADDDGTISVGDIVFAGQKWDLTLFSFYNNILLSVQFNLGEQMTSLNIMDSAWESFQNKLWDKYSDYAVDSQRSDMIFYTDGITRLSLAYLYISSNKILTLQYADTDLSEQKSQAEIDEL